MATAIPTMERVAEAVALAAEREGYTPFGLFDYIRDIESAPEAYGSDLKRDQIEDRLFGGTGVSFDDVTASACRAASHWHRERVRAMVRRWDAEAFAKGVPVTYILEGDAEMGWEARLASRREAEAEPSEGSCIVDLGAEIGGDDD